MSSASSSRMDVRGRQNTLICNNCRRDKQKCQRHPDDIDGSMVCMRCDRYNYSHCSTDPSVQPMERKKRILNDLKCDKCRKDHKTCTFSYGPWPNPCDRCLRTTGSQCSAPTRPTRTRNSRGGSTHDSGSDSHSTIAPSEYGDYTEYGQREYEYTTGYEDDCYDWQADANTQWQEHYSHPMYHMNYTSPFSPDSSSSDYSDGATPFILRQ
ncbi:hypothetical protein H072_4260 [Dactylellina haptotyla CBS 200.50]|uniref:Uncharacterized protein n=1 Tax=Dactylellina haptotyla (strain CBS 200.50) TaxID=1284197 RepID=S8AKZ2_DACHA|nr:hypothetical protein H072_4260 [Dactylellina haptotyla CBS 200.50]